MPPEPDGNWDTFQRYAARFYSSAPARAGYLAHARAVLTRTSTLTGVPYASDPTIMAWELANEPRPMRSVAPYREWLDEVCELIRDLAPHQLITIGTEGRTPFPQSYVGIDFDAELAHSGIDYGTVHVWPQNWEWYRPLDAEATYGHALNRSLEYLRGHVRAAEALGKPLVLEEFGMARDELSHEVPATCTCPD